MPAILSRLSVLFINYILRDSDHTNIPLCKLFVWYLVVKPACVNATLANFIYAQSHSFCMLQQLKLRVIDSFRHNGN